LLPNAANLSPLCVKFRASGIRLNIRADLKLTMARFGGALDGDVFRIEYQRNINGMA